MMNVTDEALEAARKVLVKRGWSVRKDDKTAVRHLREALEAAFTEMPTKVVTRRRPGDISMSEARDLAETYHGGEGNHPLARHRDSMG